MKIKEVTWQQRYDFVAIMECENCGREVVNRSGYNDGFYHLEVIPAMICAGCGKSRDIMDGRPNHECVGVQTL